VKHEEDIDLGDKWDIAIAVIVCIVTYLLLT